MSASVSDIIAALPDPFQRISLCRNIEQPLIGGGILHHGRSLAVDREHQVPLGFFKALQERRRIVSKRGKRLYVFGDVHRHRQSGVRSAKPQEAVDPAHDLAAA